MKSVRWLALLAAAVLAGSAAEAREKRGGRGKQPEESLFDQLVGQLVGECELSEEQKDEVRAKIKARDEALAAWDEANAEKMQEAEAAAKDARSGNDADLRKRTSGALKELRVARDESASEAAAAVFTVLTAEQKAAWEAFLLYKATVARYRRAELDEEQLAKIRSACEVAAEEIGELGEDGKPGKAEKAIIDKLRWAVDVFVLTPEQREALARKPSRKGGRGKGEE